MALNQPAPLQQTQAILRGPQVVLDFQITVGVANGRAARASLQNDNLTISFGAMRREEEG